MRTSRGPSLRCRRAPKIRHDPCPGSPSASVSKTVPLTCNSRLRLPASEGLHRAGEYCISFPARLNAVKAWISFNGGDAIYQTYLSGYGAPTDQRKWYVPQTTLPSTIRLGCYYLAHPLRSADDVIWFACVDTAVRPPAPNPVRGGSLRHASFARCYAPARPTESSRAGHRIRAHSGGDRSGEMARCKECRA
jgi:hypothetical protein